MKGLLRIAGTFFHSGWFYRRAVQTSCDRIAGAAPGSGMFVRQKRRRKRRVEEIS